MASAVMVAATKQHVGKTSTCMGLLAAAQARFGDVAFLKPVGQQHVATPDGQRVDKDCKLAREYFGLSCDYQHMSPVVVPQGYTREFLDGAVTAGQQERAITDAFEALQSRHAFTVIEGTGHTGVGSIVDMNNAQVAALLGVDMVLVCTGGLGSAFDELELNRVMCARYGVNIRGVVVNKVRPDRLDMVTEYMGKACARVGLDLLGVVPEERFLQQCTMRDLEQLFGTELLSGHANRMQHFDHTKVKLITTGLRRFLESLEQFDADDNRLLVAHASRNDAILGILAHANLLADRGQPFRGAVVLTGVPPRDAPQQYIQQLLETTYVPFLYAPQHSFDATASILNYTAKLNAEDEARTRAAVETYSAHVDWERFF